MAVAASRALTDRLACAAAEIEDEVPALTLDPSVLGQRARSGGNPVIPLVAELRHNLSEGTAAWVHWGATSQDILDTAAVLVAVRAGRLVDGHLALRDTLMLARTLLQPACRRRSEPKRRDGSLLLATAALRWPTPSPTASACPARCCRRPAPGGSSTLPHKPNPVAAALAGGAVANAAAVVAGLQVDPAAMRSNLDRVGPVVLSERVVLALTPLIGREAATAAVAEAAAAPDFAAALRGRGIDLDDPLDPTGYLGATGTWVDRALAAHQATMPWYPPTVSTGRRPHRGHGGTAPPAPGPYTIADLGDDVVKLLDHLGVERATLCGLSLGGMVALWAAHHPERVERLVLACTIAGMLEAADPEGCAGCCEAIAAIEQRADLQRVSAPRLVVAGGPPSRPG